MKKAIIYTTRTCPYCMKAKTLLQQKNIPYEEIDVSNDQERRTEMVRLAGGRKTVPQIFINGEHVGGCDDLYALNQAQKL